MNLSFITKFPKTLPPQLVGQQTHFVQKIWASLVVSGVASSKTMLYHYQDYFEKFNKHIESLPKASKFNPKHHTIREDTKNRWQAGNFIHFYIHTRTKNQFNFAPIIPCVSTQKIEIIWKDFDGFKLCFPIIYIDDVWITPNIIEKLAINDGFDNTACFLAYFNTNFTGKIIHWTHLKY